MLAILMLLPGICRAEAGYVNIRDAITASIGECVSKSSGQLPDEHVISLLFNPAAEDIFLWGKNEQGETEGCLWKSDQGPLLLGGYCGSWAALCDSLEEGYRLNIILQTGESDDPDAFLLIDSAEKADIMYNAILGNMKQ